MAFKKEESSQTNFSLRLPCARSADLTLLMNKMSVFVITSMIRPFSQLKSFISIFLPARIWTRPHLEKSERLAADGALREPAVVESREHNH